MFKKLLPVIGWILIILISIFLGLQVQAEIKPTPAPAKQPAIFTDIEPKTITFEDYTPPRKTKDNTYIKRYNQGVDYYNNQSYAKAVSILTELSAEYKDGGKTLFLAGACYYTLKEYELAIRYFHQAMLAGYDQTEALEFIFQSLTGLGNQYSDQANYSEAIAYYKAALNYKPDPVVLHNTVFCYIEFAKRLKKPDQITVLLFAYDFILANNFKDETLGVLANNLCNYLLNPPLTGFPDQAVACIVDALATGDDPYLHQSLGFIYLYQNKPELAKAEFKQVFLLYPNTKYAEVSQERYQDIGNALYHYRAVYPIRVQVNSGSASSLYAEVTLQMPQSYEYQTSKNLKVTFNKKSIPVKIVKDQFGTQYLNLELDRIFNAGKNELAVECTVEVQNKRINTESIANYHLTDYRPSDSRYQALTQSNEIMTIEDYQVQALVREIKHKVKSDRVLDLVKAVYDKVIDLLAYENTGTQEKVSVKRALANPEQALCEDYAALTVTLLRALKIPAAYFSADTYQKPVGHAWAVFYTPDFLPVPIDTTWGDTSNMPDLYFFATSNLNLIMSFGYDSDLMPGGATIKINSVGDSGVEASLGTSEVRIDKIDDGQ
ncbi:MAG TPA: transglutaminase domain-containing protein [Bacillota bacterium]|nr:transglutaminase domain-containing protein [Bacillota bacterium]